MANEEIRAKAITIAEAVMNRLDDCGLLAELSPDMRLALMRGIKADAEIAILNNPSADNASGDE